jgi:predicted kinase
MKARTLFLCRGEPGSGKSSLARRLAPYHCYAADDFFEKDGGYDFDRDKLGEAHAWCQERTEADMVEGVPFIAVHNTFSKAWEARFYYELAEKYGYSVFVVEAQNDFGNVHGVPPHVIENMRDRWEPLNRPLASLRHVLRVRLRAKYRAMKGKLRSRFRRGSGSR